MARKITVKNLEEYDLRRLERKRNFDKDVESKLEGMLRSDKYVKRIRKRLKKQAEETKFKLGAVDLLLLHSGLGIGVFIPDYDGVVDDTLRKMLKDLIKQEKEKLLPIASKHVFRRQRKENIADLVLCAYSLNSSSTGKIPLNQRRDIYTRFIDEVMDLAYSPYNTGISESSKGIYELIHKRKLPKTEGKASALRKSIATLKKKGYIKPSQGRDLLEYLFPKKRKKQKREPSKVSTPEVVEGQTAKTKSKRRKSCKPEKPLFSIQERKEYLQLYFQLSHETARRYAFKYTLEEVDRTHERLANSLNKDNIDGKVLAASLIRLNPEILDYSSKRIMTKYITTIKLMQEEIERDYAKTEELEKEFGITENLREYSDLEKLLELKRGLFSRTEKEFDIEGYKQRLLEETDLDEEITRALTEGRNRSLRRYVTRNRFKNKMKGKVSRAKVRLFDEEFNKMIEGKAIIANPKGLYRLNSDLTDIPNEYLREYMRMCLYGERILNEGGEIVPLFDSKP